MRCCIIPIAAHRPTRLRRTGTIPSTASIFLTQRDRRVLFFRQTQPDLRHLDQGSPRHLIADCAQHLKALLREAPILFCPTHDDPHPFVRYLTNAPGEKAFPAN